MVAIEPAPLTDGLYEKVGGWLVLPAIATYLTPFFMAYSAYENFQYFSFSLPTASQQIIVGFGLACNVVQFSVLHYFPSMECSTGHRRYPPPRVSDGRRLLWLRDDLDRALLPTAYPTDAAEDL